MLRAGKKKTLLFEDKCSEFNHRWSERHLSFAMFTLQKLWWNWLNVDRSQFVNLTDNKISPSTSMMFVLTLPVQILETEPAKLGRQLALSQLRIYRAIIIFELKGIFVCWRKQGGGKWALTISSPTSPSPGMCRWERLSLSVQQLLTVLLPWITQTLY